MERLKKTVAAAAAIAILASCSGSAVGSLPVTGFSAPPAARTIRPSTQREGSVRAKFSVQVPKASPRAKYVSPFTKSIVIVANKKKLGAFNVLPASKGCKTVGGATQCVIDVNVPAGRDTFRIAAYGATNGGGSVLSAGTVVQRVKPDVPAIILVTLEGVVKSAVVNVANDTPPAGTAITTPVYVTAYDAAGAAIIGPGNYSTPITLSDSDSSRTSLSTTTVAGPSTQVTLSYDGKSLLGATISASASGIPTAQATFSPVPTIVASYSAPILISGTIPYAIAAAPDGSIWFTTYGTSAPNAVVHVDPNTGLMTPYVGGAAPGLTNDTKGYQGIVAGPDGNMWFTERNNKKVGKITPGGVVTEYTVPGSMCPNRIVAGSQSDGGLWFTSDCNNEIAHVTTGGSTAGGQALAGGGNHFEGILLGKDSNLYVVDYGNKAIGQVTISAGSVTGYQEVPVGLNPIDLSSNSSLLGLAQTGDGTIWWTNDTCTPSTIGGLAIASPFVASSVKQYVTKAGCSYPAFPTVAPAGSQMLWIPLWDWPIIEEAVAPAGGGTPALTDFAIETTTPNGLYQELFDSTLDTNGNVWSTNRDAGNPNGNIVKLVY